MSDIAKRELTVDALLQFGRARMQVTGTSMLPSVVPGDIISVDRRAVCDLQVGQIVLCYRNQSFTVHRLVGKHGETLTTRGDSLPYDDPPFRGAEVLGEVTRILRNGRPVSLQPVWWHPVVSKLVHRSTVCTRILLRLQRTARLAWAG